jgi:hypothetical protein
MLWHHIMNTYHLKLTMQHKPSSAAVQRHLTMQQQLLLLLQSCLTLLHMTPSQAAATPQQQQCSQILPMFGQLHRSAQNSPATCHFC